MSLEVGLWRSSARMHSQKWTLGNKCNHNPSSSPHLSAGDTIKKHQISQISKRSLPLFLVKNCPQVCEVCAGLGLPSLPAGLVLSAVQTDSSSMCAQTEHIASRQAQHSLPKQGALPY